jgi:hypothetical protein
MIRHPVGRGKAVSEALAALALALVTAPVAVAQGSAQLTADPGAVPPGGTVTAYWSGTSAPTSIVWLYLYRSDGRYTGVRLQSRGAAEGACLFTLPLGIDAGRYELQLYDGEGRTRLVTSNAFDVKNVPGFVASSVYRLPGELTSVQWNNVPAGIYWVGLYPAGVVEAEVRAWQATSGNVFGAFPFVLPGNLLPGRYEFHLLTNDRRTLLATSNPFFVRAAVAGATVSPVEIAPGQALTVTWHDVRSRTPQIRLYLYDIYGHYRGEWMQGGPASGGTVRFELPKGLRPGTYELRVYDDEAREFLLTSNRFTVDPIF